MVYQVNFDEAKARLLDLIDAAMRGDTVFIVKEDQPVVQLIPVARPKRRHFGSASGLITMTNDFDAPLVDFGEYQE